MTDARFYVQHTPSLKPWLYKLFGYRELHALAKSWSSSIVMEAA